jgi:hypothetical protein
VPCPSRRTRDGQASTKPSLFAAFALVEAARFLGGHLIALRGIKLGHRGLAKACRFESSESDYAFSAAPDFRIRRFWTKVVFALTEKRAFFAAETRTATKEPE